MRLLSRFIYFLITPSRQRTRFLFFGVVFAAFCGLPLTCIFWWSGFGRSYWTPEAIHDRLGVEIPVDAADVEIDGCYDGSTTCSWLDLSFKASPDSTMAFANDLLASCNGVLHQHYNPFNAIDSDTEVDYEFAFTVFNEGFDGTSYGAFGYYTYSPAADGSQHGTRCSPKPTSGTMYEILINQENSELYTFRLYSSHGWYPRADETPALGFPLRVRGIYNFGYRDVSYEVSNYFCMEIDPLAYLDGDMWSHLIGATVQVYIDDELSQAAYVSDQGMLIPTVDREGNRFQPDGMYFNDCIYGLWEPGIHTVILEITPMSGEIHSYSWQFRG